ncbi:MAG: nucleoside-diphosphate kinase [Spirochaetes bacterium]|jgi:nucleoside-diphosphate kinase|nr:nucleoside-diphosphate kinase [Spirochaetota bacterium]
MENKKIEQTVVLIKPDALKLSLTGYILSELSEYHTGLLIAGAKVVNVSRMLAEEHYEEHRGKPFFPSLLEYIAGNLHFPKEPDRHALLALVYQGQDVVKKIRAIAGPTNPHTAREERPGCIRSIGSVISIKDAQGKVIGDRIDNLIHASATDAEAEREIKLWFKPCDIPHFMHAYQTEVSDNSYYYNNNKISTTYEPGSMCLFAPGDIDKAWKSDLDTLRLLSQGKTAPVPLNTVIAKYLINKK